MGDFTEIHFTGVTSPECIYENCNLPGYNGYKDISLR